MTDSKEDLEAFIEYEQDRDLKISTVRTRLATLIAFLHFLIEQAVISGAVLKKKIKLKLPETLPRAMNPLDVKKLLSVIEDIQERALILILLRTGIRIGEALGLTVNDLDIRERKIHLFEGEKNSMGRVVYLSDDALFALKRWLHQRDPGKECIFYTRDHARMSYSTARSRFSSYLKSAGLGEKGHTVHCLRHTFASELLNAGMRLECLQQLMSHQDIEVTRRYARLSSHTVKNYMNIPQRFISRLTVPLSQVTHREIGAYVDHLLSHHRKPKTIMCHLQTLRLFFDHPIKEEGKEMNNPVIRVSIRLPKPLPRHLKDEQVVRGFTLMDNSGSISVRAKLPDNKKLDLSLNGKVKVFGNLQGGQEKVFDGYVIKKPTGEQIIVTNPTPHFGFIIQSSFR